MEKFKNVFPDRNIEAALIAMDDFAAMQTKAKQLVHIYKPAHDSPMASAAILVHTVDNTLQKASHRSLKVTSISWPRLINLNHKKTLTQGILIIMGDNAEGDAEIIEVPMAVEMQATLVTSMIIRIGEPAAVKDNGNFMIIEGADKIIHIVVDEDSGMVMT